MSSRETRETPISPKAVRSFRRIVWAHYRRHARDHLPWRATRDPYAILVSEVMLQQTSVERVEKFYPVFLKRFPTVHILARAPLSSVIAVWQGLGYNRRAKMLLQAAQIIERNYEGKIPSSLSVLESLPGVGRYTARAVALFAFDIASLCLETNIRTAILHHFFSGEEKVSDRAIEEVLARVSPKKPSRAWNFALMDYGSCLKKRGVRLNAHARVYTKQKPFAGSLREARGAILRALVTNGPSSARALTGLLGAVRQEQMRIALAALLREGFVEKKKNRYALSKE